MVGGWAADHLPTTFLRCSLFTITPFPHTPHFGLGQNSITIKRVGHGWVRTYHIETRTTKEFIPLWNKHTTMPLMRLVVCFDGRIMSAVTSSPPSFSSAHPVPHVSFRASMPFTIYAFYTISYLVVLILFLFNLSHVLLTLCVRTHPNFTTTASSSPHFSPPVITYNRHSTGIRIPVQNINTRLCC